MKMPPQAGFKKWIAGVLLGISLSASMVKADDAGRQTLNFNQGWRFQRMDAGQPAVAAPLFAPDLSDQKWELVNVPHSVRLEPANASGGQNFQGLCWYRKHFRVEDGWRGKKLFLQFDGAMQVADVWLNGKKVTTHYGGYLPFSVDITDLVQIGADNVVALQLDNRDQPLVPPGKPQHDLDFCYFGGLYRDVHLLVTDRLHVSDPLLAGKVAGGGIFVTYPQVSAQNATVQVKTDVQNETSAPVDCTVKQDLLSEDGQVVASHSSAVAVAPGSNQGNTQELTVANPKLWHPDHPTLYSLHTQVYRGGLLADDVTTRIGIHTFEFRNGALLINGEPYFSVGFNHHQDYLYLGYAVPDSLLRTDVKKMREANLTSFRSHYPHAPAFMNACDELGVLTIVSAPGWQYWNDDPTFKERLYQNVREMIRLERNHPSVILWEVGLNETGYPKEYAQTVQKIAHEEIPAGPCYTSGDGSHWDRNQDWRREPVFDVLYQSPPGDQWKGPLWWREFGDFVDMNWTDQVSANRVSRAMGEAAMLLQARSHEQKLHQVTAANVAGCGLWAGIDCDRGYHPLPFLGGVLDKARLPKFDFYLFASQRPAGLRVPGLDDGPMVFIASLATHYSAHDVTVYSNCEEVRLLRGKDKEPDEVVAVKKVASDGKVAHAPVVFENALEWWDGQRLKAQGLIGGNVVAEQTVGAAGVPRKLVLCADGEGHALVADGSDVVPVRAFIEDHDGNTVAFDERTVRFTVTGAGRIVGDASIEANPVRTELGIATALIQSTPTAGAVTIHAQAQGLLAADLRIESKPLREKVAAGRDVGKEAAPPVAGAHGTPSAGAPAVLPNAQVAEDQRQSDLSHGNKPPEH